MKEKNEPINFFDYKNKFSTNNHKNLGLHFLPLLKQTKNIRMMKKSNSEIFPIFDSNNGNYTFKSSQFRNKGKNKQILLNKKLIIKNKQYNSGTFNNSMFKLNNITDLRNETSFGSERNIFDLNNLNVYKNFYKCICLGKDNNKSEIKKVNSPLVKYFLYNIFQNNKRNNKFHKYLNHQLVKENHNNNAFKPNFFLIQKIINDKYNNLIKRNNTSDTQNVFKIIDLNNKSNNLIKDNQLNSEESSSSGDNQIDSSDLEKLIKIEENKNKITNTKLKTTEINLSSFLKTNCSKKIKIIKSSKNKLGNLKNLKMSNFYKDLNLFHRPSFSNRKKIYF